MASQTTKTFGRYEVVRLLGRGAVGEVYLARDPALDRLVAVKTLPTLASLPPRERREVTERFTREARAAAALTHPNIVTIYDVGEQDGVPYMAMEFLEGTTLDRYTRRGHLLPPAKVLEIGIQAAIALARAHAAGIVHRDVKPANLVLLEDGTVKVTDFGLAKDPATGFTAQEDILGTPNYMAPEQVAGRAVDGRADLFALAVTLFELLTGELPFPGDSVSSVLYRIVNEPPRKLRESAPHLPAELEQLLERMMAKDPAGRLPNGDQFAVALQQILEKMGGVPADLVLPLPAAPAKAPSGPRRPAPEPAGGAARRRGRRLPWLLLALVAALAALWTAPRWAGRDPIAPVRPAITARLSSWLGPLAERLGLAPPPRLVALETDPPGLPLEIVPAGATAAEDRVPHLEPGEGGEVRLVLPAFWTDPVELRVADRCLQGGATVDPRDPPPALAVAARPRLVPVPVASEPPGAAVEVDGERAGRTPLELELPLCHEHTVVLSAAGRTPATVRLPADGSGESWAASLAQVTLSAVPDGRLVVPRAPYPVEIVDRARGRRIGRAGDTLALPPGRYRLRLVNRDLLFEATATVRIASGKTERLAIDYPGVAHLTVKSVPFDAPVSVRPLGREGRPVELGRTTLRDRALVAGTYEVRVENPTTGRTVTRQVTLVAGGTEVLEVKPSDWL